MDKAKTIEALISNVRLKYQVCKIHAEFINIYCKNKLSAQRRS